MKYQLISETNGKGLLETVLDNRNLTIEQVKELLNTDEKYCNNPFEIYGMNKAVDFLIKYITKI